MARLGLRRVWRKFGKRYDDPLGTYRVLYATSQRLGAFVETLAPYRPDPAILAATIASDPPVKMQGRKLSKRRRFLDLEPNRTEEVQCEA